MYEVIAALPASTLWLLGAGGLLYTFGVIFHLWEGLRFQNAIWHVFVVLAAACHYTAVIDYLATAHLERFSAVRRGRRRWRRGSSV